MDNFNFSSSYTYNMYIISTVGKIFGFLKVWIVVESLPIVYEKPNIV